tara:strand:- start:595 stop:1434 length:840 start_codon:yes stop_codon:yes gene_type:complete
MDENIRKEIFQEYLSERRRGRIPVEMDFDSFVDMMVDRAMDQLSEGKSGMRNGGIIGLANGGRIGFDSGSKGTVDNDRKMRDNYFDLKRDEFMSLSEYMESPIAVRDLQNKALGGRIGFQDGQSVQRVAENTIKIPELGTGDMIKYFRDALKQANPDATDEELDDAAEKMFRGELAVKDSKRGLGSMVAMADDDEVKDPSDMLTDDAMDMLQTDPFELLKDAVEKGTIAELSDSDIYSMYDAAVERGTFDGTFEEFKNMLGQLQQRQRRPEGIMQTMVA